MAAEPRHRRGVMGGRRRVAQTASHARGLTRGIETVFDSHRDPVQQPEGFTEFESALAFPCLRQGLVRQHRDEGIQRGVSSFDLPQVRRNQLHRRDSAIANHADHQAEGGAEGHAASVTSIIELCVR